jgi:hypothetical protein
MFLSSFHKAISLHVNCAYIQFKFYDIGYFKLKRGRHNLHWCQVLVPRVEVRRISSKLLSWTAFINFLPHLQDLWSCRKESAREKILVSMEVLLISGDIRHSWWRFHVERSIFPSEPYEGSQASYLHLSAKRLLTCWNRNRSARHVFTATVKSKRHVLYLVIIKYQKFSELPGGVVQIKQYFTLTDIFMRSSYLLKVRLTSVRSSENYFLGLHDYVQRGNTWHYKWRKYLIGVWEEE